jgi:hypothetical protein
MNEKLLRTDIKSWESFINQTHRILAEDRPGDQIVPGEW